MEIIIGAAILLPTSALASALTLKYVYFSKREQQAQQLISDYDQANLDLMEIFALDHPAVLGMVLEESTDFLTILAQAAIEVEDAPASLRESPVISDEPVSISSSSSERSTSSEVSTVVKEEVVPVRRYTFRTRRPKDRIAHALAQEAYYNFGNRQRSEANNLITRRWMRDRLDDYDSIRFKDRATIIDIALVLSFVPSLESREIEGIALTDTFTDRSTTIPLYRLFMRLFPSYREDASRATH
jgi:hypothetical protein